MRRLSVLALAVLLLAFPASSQAITFGQVDGHRHPNVGALLADYDPDSPGLDVLCTGTLIDDRVLLTAAHCTAFLESIGIDRVRVNFEPRWDEASTSRTGTFKGTYVNHPEYGAGGQNDPHDIAVVLLERSPGIEPAELPRAGLLDRLAASHTLDDRTFTAVGYGTVREDKTGGFQSLFFDGKRRFVTQEALNIQKAWLLLSMNPSTGNGGTCYGDSGGPHFLGGPASNLLVSLTVTGDAPCRATDKTYRVDTAVAREFLDDFVDLP